MARLRFFGKLITLGETYLAQYLAYRGELFFWVLSQSLPFLFLALWVEGGPRPDREYVRYYFFAWLLGLFRPTWMAYTLSYEIRTGRLSPLLLRPFSPVFDHLADALALSLLYLPLGLPVFGLLYALLPGFLAGLSPGDAGAFLGYLALGFAFHFALGWLFGALAFFLERSDSLLEPYYGLLFFFGGLALPLDALPEGLLRGLSWTPLPYLVYYPAARAAGWEAEAGYGLLIVWTLFVSVLAAWAWRRGLVRYSSMGA